MCLPLSVFWEAVRGRCAAYTPGGVLVANLLGSFTLGLLTMVWNAYARRDGEERIHSFRLLFAPA